MGTQLTFLPGCSAFSLPGAWPSTDSLEETVRLLDANTPNEEPRCIVPDTSRSEAIEPRSVSNATGEGSLRNSVATYDDDSDDFYSFIEDQEVQQICVIDRHMLIYSSRMRCHHPVLVWPCVLIAFSSRWILTPCSRSLSKLKLTDLSFLKTRVQPPRRPTQDWGLKRTRLRQTAHCPPRRCSPLRHLSRVSLVVMGPVACRRLVRLS